MYRYRLTVEFDGTPFSGWQRQENAPSVQAALEKAGFAFCGAPTPTQSAGRTDTGVHAFAMSVHIDLPKEFPADVVRDALNAHLRSHPVAIISAEAAPADFHARFSCERRHYLYRIINRRAPLTLDANRAWRVSRELDANAMDDAAQVLVGRHDFTTFRAVACQADSPVKTMGAISVRRQLDEIILTCSARSFLHHQVRSITGTLVEVGRGRWRRRDVQSALTACDRRSCGPVAPSMGLYFVKADYPETT